LCPEERSIIRLPYDNHMMQLAYWWFSILTGNAWLTWVCIICWKCMADMVAYHLLSIRGWNVYQDISQGSCDYTVSRQELGFRVLRKLGHSKDYGASQPHKEGA
jgi:hypothetical protein